MEGIICLFLALLVALVALGAVLAARLPPRTNQVGHCPSCRTPISLRRVSLAKSHALLGEWECPHCRRRMDKKGRMAGTVI
jgi:ribosomal protein L37AE/L43A